MLDLKAIRSDPAPAREALARRGDGSEERLDRVLELDERRRAITPELDELRAARNAASKRIGELQRSGEDASAAIAEVKDSGERFKELEAEAKSVAEELDGAVAQLPNPPDPTAADQDTVLREVGESGASGRDHLELLGDLVDLEAGAAVAGSRFAYIKGPLVLLELALVRWAMELLGGHGFTPVIPPVLVREEALYGTGFLPDTEQQIYRVPDDDLYLAGTSEVPLASLHAGQILDEAALPLRYAGYSPCFRREAGAAGRDTRGHLPRAPVRQGRDVLVRARRRFRGPSTSASSAIEEEIMQALELPYRVVNIAVDDLGNSAAKKYDVEVWLPGQERHRELTSCSNTTDFQARRLDIRYRPAEGKGTVHAHTLNGTAVAVGRTIIALVENGQQEDGSIVLPEPLVRWGAPERIEPAG